MVDFELIKGRIQKHKLSSILHNCLEILNQVQRRDDKSFPVWNVLTLIRWAYLHTTDSILRKPIQDHEFTQLLDLIRDFEVKYDGLDFKNHMSVRQSMRIIAYQQFALQDPFHNVLLARQIQLYFDQPEIEAMFLKHTGITLKNFLEYCYFTFFFFHADRLGKPEFRYEGDLSGNYFELFRSKWGDAALETFLLLLTIYDKEGFVSLQKLNEERMQLYESNFMILKPFIFFRDSYRLPHRAMFTQTIKHFIYNYLKANDPRFTELFGRRLEMYVRMGLEENKLPWENESMLRKQYGLTKTADYRVSDNILIEIKAIELHPRAGVMRTKDILARDLDSNIIKAYTQLLSVANAINPDRAWYGIILTYKDMYLGFGSDAWEEFLSEPVNAFCEQNSTNLSVLPPANLFFMDIEDWDHAMQAVEYHKVTLQDILERARYRNTTGSVAEKVMLMHQVLHQDYYVPRYTLKYLEDKHKVLDIIPER